MYYFRVLQVNRVVDGDTLDLTVDLGFHLTKADRYRLTVVDTPERGEPGWAEATAFVKIWLADHPTLQVDTYRSDSFGRWLGDIHTAEGDSLSSALLQAGLGEVWS